MTDANKRLDRMLPFLSAKERGIMTLRDYKAGKAQDRALLNSTTDQQSAEFNRYIGMMNAANGDLASVILVIRERATQEELRFSWLEWARICAMEMYAVRASFAVHGREPITASAFQEKEAEARAELIPIDECAMLYTEYHHRWEDADYGTDGDGDQAPTDEAWYRVRDAKLDEMQKAVADGTLRAAGKGKRMKIASGSFHDWIGEPMPVPPDLGIEYDVRPDDRWREVERERKSQAFIGSVLDRGACLLEMPLDMESPLVFESPPGGFGVELARVVAVQIRAAIKENWRELRAIEIKVDAFTVEFEGEDVLHPLVRERLDDAKQTLTKLHGEVQAYTGPFELPEPDAELNAMVQRIIDREMRNVPTR